MSGPEPDEPTQAPSHIPERFREDYDPAPDWTDPVSGVTYPINPRDVLDPEELREYQQQRRQRPRRRKR